MSKMRILDLILSKLRKAVEHCIIGGYLYIAVTTPPLDYTAMIWHRPGDTRTSPTTSQLRAPASAQSKIMRAITGCCHTTAIKALEYETVPLSSKWRLTNKILHECDYKKQSRNPHMDKANTC
jgi:hypothetical protein